MNGRSGKLRRYVACWLLLIVLPACDSKIDVDAHRRGSANHAMIAVANPLAAKAGFDVLQDGGSAVDAAIAAELVLTLVEPQSSGIGGGAFLVHLDGRQGRVETFDGRETAPASAAPDMFIGSDGKPLPWHITADLGRAVGIPGLLRMFESAHRAHGILPWARLFAPAINLAQDGFIVSPRLAKLLTQEKRLREIPGTSDYFFPGGEALKAGDTLKNPRLAATLKSVATLGASSFYSGEIAAEISARVATARNGATKITPQDLGGYRAPERPPVCVPYRQYKVCGMGPPSSGGILIAQMLGILSHFDLPSMAPYSPEAVHLIVEASRLTFADRNLYVADADMVPVPIDKLIDLRFIPVVLGFFIATQILLLDGTFETLALRITRSLIVFTMFWSAIAVVEPLSLLFGQLRDILSPVMRDWIMKALKILLGIVGAAAVLQLWGIEIGPLVAGLGLFGLAAALAAQDLFRNLLSGVLILAEKRFNPGDWIRVDGVVEGTVHSVGFRSTMIRQFDKAMVQVPNTKLADTAVINFSEMTHRRIYWKVGVLYDTTAAQLREIRDGIETFILENEAFASPDDVSTFVRIDSFNDSSIDIMVYCFTKTTVWGEWLQVKESLAYKIKEIVEGAGSGFAFPSRSLYLEAVPNDAPETFAPPEDGGSSSFGEPQSS